MSLQEIDALIDQTEYNKALLEVVKYMKSFPNDFDRAQLRVERILTERVDYNSRAEELVLALEEVTAEGDEEEDSEAAYERDEQRFNMISELEEIERRQSKTQKDFTNQARRTISMGFYIRQYNRIMSAGLALSDEEKFMESMLRYKAGFSSVVVESGHDKIFYDEDGVPLEIPIDYHDVMLGKKNVDQLATEIIGVQEDPGRIVKSGKIYELTKDYEELYKNCQDAYDGFVRSIQNGRMEDAQFFMTGIKTNFAKFREVRNALLVQARELEKLDLVATDAIRKRYNLENSNADISNSYISYAANFIKGDESVPGTGMVGAMDMSYCKWVEGLKNTLVAKIQNNFTSSEQNLPIERLFADETKFDPNISSVATVSGMAGYGKDTQVLYDGIRDIKGKKMESALPELASSFDFVNKFSKEFESALSDAKILAAKNIFESTADIDAQVAAAIRFEEILNMSSNPAPEFIGKEKTSENSYFASEPEKKVLGFYPIQFSDRRIDFRKDIDYFNSLRQKNIEMAQNRAGEVWGNIAGLFAKKGTDSSKEYQSNYSLSTDIMNGTNETGMNPDNMDKENDLVKKNSKGAYENAQGLNEHISSLEKDIASWNKALERGRRFASTKSELKNGMDILNSTLQSLSELKEKNSVLLKEAQRRYDASKRLIESGKSHYNLMERAANNFDYDTSSEQYELALKDYYEALDYQYSEELVELINQLNALRSKVREIEVDEALAEVDRLKRQANEYIFNGNFTPAVTLLNQAKNLLAKKNIDPDAEIEELLLTIKDIQKSVKEKTLSLQNPHYEELSRSLDEGHKDYDAGIQLKKAGKTAEAKEKFEGAKFSVNNVLNEQPYNDEARDILFQTEYQLNPGESFRTQFFEPKFREAEKEKDLDTLRDLEKFIPDYPGLKALIKKIENEQNSRAQSLKNRVDPKAKSAASDAKQTAEANRLAQEAQRIYSSANGNEERMAEALKIANQALVIDSKNTIALRVSSAVRRARATVADAPLTIAQTRLLTAARNLRNSAPEKAMEYMNQLMSNAAAARNTEVKKLFEQIQRRLGN